MIKLKINKKSLGPETLYVFFMKTKQQKPFSGGEPTPMFLQCWEFDFLYRQNMIIVRYLFQNTCNIITKLLCTKIGSSIL